MTEAPLSVSSRSDGPVNRRSFIKIAALAATVAGTSTAQDRPAGPSAPVQGPRVVSRSGRRSGPPPPPNEVPLSTQFQASPGGTGALVEELSPLRRQDIPVLPWEGPRPRTAEEIAFLPVHRLAALIRGGELTSTELTEIYLDRINRLNPKLLCAVNVMEGSARKEAARADEELQAGHYRGPLHGIPYGIKDLFSVRGVPTTWGVEPFAERVIDEDSEISIRLRQAGAVLIAKLATGAFASGDRWFRGQTKNPWNPVRGSSGSSAGPGSATAAGCVAFSVGTETLGSIVSPSMRCGISALRPTFGRVSRHGAMTLSWSMDKAGPMCRTIEDCALVFNVIHGADPKDPSTVSAPFEWQRSEDLSGLRIGYAERTPEIILTKLRELGAKPKPVGPRPSSEAVRNVLNIESSAAFEYFFTENPEAAEAGRTNAARRFRINQEQATTALEYIQAQRHRLLAMREMEAFMEDLDLYVSLNGDSGLTNLTGHPVVVFPYQFGSSLVNVPDQPRCATLVGRLFGDDLILTVANAYQSATEWHTRHPEIS